MIPIMCNRCGSFRDAFAEECPKCAMDDEDLQSMEGGVPPVVPTEMTLYSKIIAVAALHGDDGPNPYRDGTPEWQAWEFGSTRDDSVGPTQFHEDVRMAYVGEQFQGPYQMDTFYLGYNAFIDRGAGQQNPMIPGSPEWRGWNDGYEAAYEEFWLAGQAMSRADRHDIYAARRAANRMWEEDPELTTGQAWERAYDGSGNSEYARNVAREYGQRQQGKRVDMEYWERFSNIDQSFYRGRTMTDQQFFENWEANEADIRWIRVYDDPEWRGSTEDLQQWFLDEMDITLAFPEEPIAAPTFTENQQMTGFQADRIEHLRNELMDSGVWLDQFGPNYNPSDEEILEVWNSEGGGSNPDTNFTEVDWPEWVMTYNNEPSEFQFTQWDEGVLMGHYLTEGGSPWTFQWDEAIGRRIDDS